MVSQLPPTFSDNGDNNSQSLLEEEEKKSGKGSPNGGRKEVLISGKYYDVTDWIRHHPGGKVISFYTLAGEDATIPFLEFHKRVMGSALRVRGGLPNRPADPDTLKGSKLTQDFLQLREEFEREGLYSPSYSHVLSRVLEFLWFLAMAWVVLNCEPSSSSVSPAKWLLLKGLGTFLLTMAFGRVVWLAHEGGHCSLTGSKRMDALLQKFLYGFGNGLSGSWWNHNHHLHHAMPQRVGRDVDLESLPFVAFTAKILSKSAGKVNPFIRYQGLLFLPLYTFLVVVRWSLHLHPRYCWRKKEYFELFCLVLHFTLLPLHFGILPFLFAKYFWGIYMFGNFSVSHTHLDALMEEDVGTHWVQYAFQNTINVREHWLVNWWMGYLNFQIEHHLFPSMPNFRGPRVKERVKGMAERNGLPYREVGYFEAVRMMVQNLQNVAHYDYHE